MTDDALARMDRLRRQTRVLVWMAALNLVLTLLALLLTFRVAWRVW